jgi:hypothetical protein
MDKNIINDIFTKRDDLNDNSEENLENEDNKISFDKNEICASIPDDALMEPSEQLLKNNIELRWRYFKFPDKENLIVEISFKKPNEERMYMNNKGTWVLYDDDKEFDTFITKSYYKYMK